MLYNVCTIFVCSVVRQKTRWLFCSKPVELMMIAEMEKSNHVSIYFKYKGDRDDWCTRGKRKEIRLTIRCFVLAVCSFCCSTTYWEIESILKSLKLVKSSRVSEKLDHLRKCFEGWVKEAKKARRKTRRVGTLILDEIVKIQEVANLVKCCWSMTRKGWENIHCIYRC